MTYKFYGADTPDVKPISKKFPAIENQRELYDVLSELWCAETCAPRLRDNWSPANKTLGQCSITAFLVQDIFGGEVYGIPTGNGVHCFNVIGDVLFDLTSEQFGDKTLIYTKEHPQSRDEHFKKEEKKERYLLLRALLKKRLGINDLSI